jgi:hypothetical protein
MLTHIQAPVSHPKSHQNHDVAVVALDMPIGNVANQYPYAKGARASRRPQFVSI